MKDAGVAAACVEGERVFFFGDDEFFGWVGFKEGDACGEADYASAEDEDVGLLQHGESVEDSSDEWISSIDCGVTECDWALPIALSVVDERVHSWAIKIAN